MEVSGPYLFTYLSYIINTLFIIQWLKGAGVSFSMNREIESGFPEWLRLLHGNLVSIQVFII